MKNFLIVFTLVFLFFYSNNLLSQDYQLGVIRICLINDDVNFSDNRCSNGTLNTIFDKYHVVSIEQSFPWAKRQENKRFYNIYFEGDDILFVNELEQEASSIILKPFRFYVPKLMYDPADQLWASGLWHLSKIEADLAWNIQRGNENTKIAVIDSYFDPDHPDLKSQLLYDFDSKDTAFHFDKYQAMGNFYSHGTTVAGFAGGQTTESSATQPEGAKYASLAFNNKMIPFVMNDMLGKALFASTVMKVDVISVSAFSSCDMDEDLKVQVSSILGEILDNGTVIVTGAGNGFCAGCYKDSNNIIHESTCEIDTLFKEFTPPYPFSPLLDPRIIVVTGVTMNDSLTRRIYNETTHQYITSTYSYFDQVDVSAPGYDMWGLKPSIIRIIDTTFLYDTLNHLPHYAYDTSYIQNPDPFWYGFGGTSFAAPIVAGLASLIKAQAPWLSADEVQTIIKENVDAVKDAGYYRNPSNNKLRTGTGRINAYKALQEIENIAQNYSICNGTEEVWSETKYIKDTVVICRGSTLRIKCDVIFRPSARVVVECGGKLIVDGGRLTGSNNHLWTGVLAYSSSDTTQNSLSQSTVIVTDSGIIERARVGISSVAPGFNPDNSTYTTGGAIIIGNEGIFKDNVVAIKLNPYKYRSISQFNKCRFITTVKELEYKLNPDFFVKLEIVNGIQFKGCSFINEVISNRFNGSGIYSYNSSFSVDQYCNGTISPCAQQYITKSVFKNLNYGLKAENTGTIYSPRIENSSFITNLTAAYSSGVNAFTFRNNYIIISRYDTTGIYKRYGCGLYLDGSTGYIVRDNSFYTDTNKLALSGLTVGIIVNNSGIDNNFIEKNYFKGLDYGIHAQDKNKSFDGFTGLEIKCNKFDTCKSDISVYALKSNLGIKYYQGNMRDASNSDPAGNIFSNLDIVNYMSINNAASKIMYLHHKPKVILDRILPKSIFNVELIISKYWFDSITSCPAINGNIETRLESTSQINELVGYANSSRDSLLIRVDNGNSDSLAQKVYYAYPEEAYSLYNGLMELSPYLSDTVLYQASVKEDVINNDMIMDLLINNNHSISDDKIINSLNQREIPLSEAMYNQILAAGKILSKKELAEANIASLQACSDSIYYELISSYSSGYTNADTVIYICDSTKLLKAKIMKAFAFLSLDNYENAINSILEIMDEVNTSQSEIESYLWYLQNISEFGSIKSIPVSILSSYPFNNEQVNTFIRNINIRYHSKPYSEPYSFPSSYKSSITEHSSIRSNNPDKKRCLKVYPNPSNRFLTIECQIPESDSKTMIEIIDVQGNVCNSIDLREEANHIFLYLNQPPGNYIIALVNSDRIIDSFKITIVK